MSFKVKYSSLQLCWGLMFHWYLRQCWKYPHNRPPHWPIDHLCESGHVRTVQGYLRLLFVVAHHHSQCIPRPPLQRCGGTGYLAACVFTSLHLVCQSEVCPCLWAQYKQLYFSSGAEVLALLFEHNNSRIVTVAALPSVWLDWLTEACSVRCADRSVTIIHLSVPY